MNTAERAADRRSAIPVISIQVVDAEREFAALCGDWEKLTGLSGARVYQSFDWQWLWWRHFGDGLALHIIVLRRDGEAIGLAPFYLATEALCGVRYRRCLRLLGSPVRVRERSGVVMTYDPSDYLDIIVHPEYVSPVIQALAEHLRDHAASCDAIELVNVPDESMVLNALVPALQEGGFTVCRSRTDVCPRLRVPASLDGYVRSLRPSVRRRLQQARDAAGRGGLFTLERVEDHESTREAMRVLVELHQRRWNRSGYPGLFFEKRFERFIEDLVDSFFGRDRLWLRVMRMNGSVIAVRMGFVFNNALYDYLSGFDDESPGSKRRPGIGLLLSMIEDGARLKMDHVDFLRGDEEYKDELTSEVAHNWTITACPRAEGPADRVRAVMVFLERVATRWWRERLIVRVHSQQYGVRSGIVRYLRSRSKRLARKRRRMGNRQPAPGQGSRHGPH